jgi:hypothetical protein
MRSSVFPSAAAAEYNFLCAEEFYSALSLVIFNNMMRYMGEYRDASIQKIKDALMDSA